MNLSRLFKFGRPSYDTLMILDRIEEMESFMAGEIEALQAELGELKAEVVELQREGAEEHALIVRLLEQIGGAPDLAAVAAAVVEFQAERAKIKAVREGLDVDQQGAGG